MYLPNIDALIKHGISFDWGEIAESPEEPGIYAWFLPNLGGPSPTLGKLFAPVQKQLDQTSALTEVTGRVGTSRLSIRQSVSAEKWEARLPDTEWPFSRIQVESVANLLLALSVLSLPIYIGMTEGQNGLRERLRRHIDGRFIVSAGDPLLENCASKSARILNNPRTLKKCVVACVKITGFPDNAKIIKEVGGFLITNLKTKTITSPLKTV